MTAYNIEIEDRTFASRIRYVFDFIAHHPLAEGLISFDYDRRAPGQKIIHYGTEQKGDFFIPAQGVIFREEPPDPACLYANRYLHRNATLYSVEEVVKPEQKFFVSGLFAFDLVEAVFFHIARFEEHIQAPDMQATWGLAASECPFLDRADLLDTPVVDHLVFSFLEALGLHPDSRPTQYRMTHDVDLLEKFSGPYKLLRNIFRVGIIERRGLGGIVKVIRKYRRIRRGEEKDPYDTFTWMLRQEPLEKIIYFMAGGITKEDNHYDIHSEKARNVIELARSRGYVIGLHPSYAAYAKEGLFGREKGELEQVVGEKITKSRQHFLRFEFPVTADIIEQQGIAEDSTLGYRDKIGFRCGTGFAYHLYNFEEERPYRFKEVPLIVMEWSLLQQGGFDIQKSGEMLFRFLDKNRKNTKITFLFHNSIFDMFDPDGDDLKDMYLKLIELIERISN